MKPPQHLSRSAKRWWRAVSDTFELENHDFLRLQACCEAWDRLQAARVILDEHGVFYTDRFGQPRSHPAVALERDSRTGFLRALREMGLDHAEVGDPERPPRSVGKGLR